MCQVVFAPVLTFRRAVTAYTQCQCSVEVATTSLTRLRRIKIMLPAADDGEPD
ncbi:MAG: hypothetical protein LBF68_07540 [Christensenellaceae bacterium]|nr:hypothetical protein [Christensenellaceae bacterium]